MQTKNTLAGDDRRAPGQSMSKNNVRITIFFKILILFLLFSSNVVSAQTAFTCENEFYHVINNQLTVFDQATNMNNAIGPDYSATYFNTNAAGYNEADDLIYAVGEALDGTFTLVQIDANGIFVDLGPIAGLPPIVGSYPVGTFGPNGNLFVADLDDNLYEINVTTQTVVSTIVLSQALIDAVDIAFNATDGFFYTADANLIYQINPTTGMVVTTPVLPMLDAGKYGATWINASGELFVSNNTNGNIYQIDVTTGVSIFITSTGIVTNQNDGANCASADDPFLCINAITLTETHVDATCNMNNGSIDLTATGGDTGNYVYLWTTANGSGLTITAQDQSGLSPGTYDVLVSDGAACTATLSVTIMAEADTEDPTITCPANIVVDNDAGDCGAIVNFTAPVGTDNCPGSTTAQTTGLADGDFFPEGITTNTFVTTDADGNTGSCSFTVTVNDTEPETITCPSDIVVNNDVGACGAVVNFPDATSTDNCFNTFTVQTGGMSSGSSFPVGTSTITFTAAVEIGDVGDVLLDATCSFTITVNDTENPTITCPANIVVPNEPGVCAATVNFTAPTGMDNCPGATTVQTMGGASGSVFSGGVNGNLIEFQVTDAAGNTASCTFDITVTSAGPPTLVCTEDIVVDSDAGVCGAVVDFIAPFYMSDCPFPIQAILLGDLGPGDLFPIGTTTLNAISVTDIIMNPPNIVCTFTITVNDVGMPAITCPANITVNNDAGNCGAMVNYTTPVGTDNCPGGSTTQTNGLADGDLFPEGQTTNTFVFTDADGNSANCSFIVTVLDTEPPVPVCQTAIIELDANGAATLNLNDVLASASDNCGLQAGGQVTQSFFNCGEQGTNQVTVTVTDVNGLSGSCQANVTVQDNIAPVASCQNITVQLDEFGLATITPDQIDGGSTDNCTVNVAVSQTVFNCSNVGGSTVTLSVSDGTNTTTCTAVVTAEDNIPPMALCQDATIVLDDNGTAILLPSQVDGGSDDACGIASLSLNSSSGQADFSCNNLGQNTVTLTVTDNNGNIQICTATVTVNDETAAVILCRPSVNTVNDPGLCGADVLLLPPLVLEENCSIASVSNNAPALMPIGTTTVTWSIIDAGGNESNCLQNVTIHDTEAPQITCGNAFYAYTSWENCGYPSYLLENATATDNCSAVTITNDAPAFMLPGSYMINYSATDAGGNTATCMQWAQVIDATLPKLVFCPDNIVVEATTTDGANATWQTPSAMDNCAGPITLVSNFDSGDFFPLGETLVEYDLYDPNGQFVECDFTVSVVPIGSLSLQMTCMNDLNISQQNAMSWGVLGWNPPLMSSNCEQCDVLASDDFNFIGTLAGHQYYVQTTDEMTFTEAVLYAENLGASIAILEDKKEVPMIQNELPEGRYFIGLIDENGTNEFTWLDDTEFVPADFGSIFENETEEPAAVILNEAGEWEVVLLENLTANFVFEKRCIDLQMDIEQNDEDDNDALIESGTTATVIYTAFDECGETVSCNFDIAFVEEAVAYCTPTGIATDEENPYFIESFRINEQLVESGNDEGYADYTDHHFSFSPNEILEMTMIFGDSVAEDVPMYCRLWMDLNNDGDFFDEGELVLQGVNSDTVMSELVIPNMAQNVQNARMRIAISRLTFAESCGDFLNGEVEDYTFSIIQPELSQGIGQGTGINNITEVNLFPNPAIDKLFIQVQNPALPSVKMTIQNNLGQVLNTFVNTEIGSTQEVNIARYQTGIYFLIIEAEGRDPLIKRFVKH